MKKYSMIFVLLLTLISCSNIEKKEYLTEPMEKGYQYGFGYFDESSIDETQTIHKIATGQSYSPTFEIYNGYPNKYNFKVYFIVDYKQKEVQFLNNIVRSIDVSLEANEKKIYDVQIPDIGKGLHDIIVFVVRDPDNVLEEKRHILPDNVYLSRRVSLIVDNEDMLPEIEYKLVESNTLKDNSSIPFITRNDHEPIYSLSETLTSKHDLMKLNLNFTNKNKDQRFAIIAFIDSEQIQIKNSFLHIPKPGQVTFPLFFSKANFDWPKNLILAIVPDPYRLNKDLNMQGILFTNLVTISE